MSVHFTQYLRPDGRRKDVEIDISGDIDKIARGLVDAGYRFEVEVLNTGEVSMTCEDDQDMLASQICANDDSVVMAVISLVREAESMLKGMRR